MEDGCLSKFSIYRMSHMIFGVEKLIFGQKSRKRYWTLTFYRKIIGLRPHQICSEQYGPSKQGNL